MPISGHHCYVTLRGGQACGDLCARSTGNEHNSRIGRLVSWLLCPEQPPTMLVRAVWRGSDASVCRAWWENSWISGLRESNTLHLDGAIVGGFDPKGFLRALAFQSV